MMFSLAETLDSHQDGWMRGDTSEVRIVHLFTVKFNMILEASVVHVLVESIVLL